MTEPLPDLPSGIATGGAIGIALVLGYVLRNLKDILLPWWANRKAVQAAGHQQRKEDRRDAIQEAYQSRDDARAERDICLKDLNAAKDALSTCRAECERHKVTIEWRDQRIAELARRVQKSDREAEGGDHAAHPPG